MTQWLSRSLNQLGCMRRGIALVALTLMTSIVALAEPTPGGEAALKLPDLSSVSFLNGAINGHSCC